MNFYFHPDAERELHEGVTYYEDIQPGLGAEFAYEVHTAIMRIIQFPDAYSRFSHNSRRFLCRRSPSRLCDCPG